MDEMKPQNTGWPETLGQRRERENAMKPKITGYRELSEAEIALINRVKAKAEEVRELIEGVARHNDIDHRWLAIGQTDLQKGFMAVIRAIARPETF